MAAKIIDINEMGTAAREFDLNFGEQDYPQGQLDGCNAVECRLKATARRSERGVELEGALEASIALDCVRCLDRYEMELAERFHLVLVAEAPALDGGELPFDDVEAANRFHAEDGKADLAAVAAEQIYLNLPQKPICAADCRGLCPTCGSNRNRIQCECASEAVDPRLAPLLEWSKRRDGR